MSYFIGKCPKCEAPLSKRDIRVDQIRAMLWRPHFAYTCDRCDHIIGFCSNAPW